MRYPEGVQAVARKTDDEILIVYHAFEDNLKDIEIEIPQGFEKTNAFFGKSFDISENSVKITNLKPFTAGAVLLKKVTDIN